MKIKQCISSPIDLTFISGILGALKVILPERAGRRKYHRLIVISQAYCNFFLLFSNEHEAGLCFID